MASASNEMNKNVRLLVANKSVMEPDGALDKFEFRFSREADGFYFIDEEHDFSNIFKKMGNIYRRPVSRLCYIDSDNDEVPIDSELEFHEAMKFIGDRTGKRKFTTMKIELGSPSKSIKKKVKKIKLKAAVKASEPSAPQKTSKKPSEPKVYKKDFVAKSHEMEEPPAWFENYMNQFKTDFMADIMRNIGNLVKPLFEEQKKLSASVCHVNSGAYEYIKASASAGVSKMLTEADHNYSVTSCAKSNEESKSLTKENNNSVESGVKISENSAFNKGKEVVKEFKNGAGQAMYEDDDNLSIYSGVISITDSESDAEEGPDDFVEIPFPACFNVVDPKGVMLQKEQKPFTAEMLTKATMSELPHKTQEDEIKSPSKSNFINASGLNDSTLKNSEAEEEQYICSSRQDTSHQIKESINGTNIPSEETSIIHFSESQVADKEKFNEVEKKLFDKDHNVVKTEGDVNVSKQDSNSSSVSHKNPMDLNAKFAQGAQQLKQQVPTSTPGCASQQNEKSSAEAIQQKYTARQTALPQEDTPPTPLCGSQYITQSGPYTNSQLLPAVTPKVPLFSNSARQGIPYPQQSMPLPMPTAPVSAQGTYLQQIQKQGLQQPLQPYNSVVYQPPMLKIQPPNVQQAVMKAAQQFANYHLLEAQVAVQAQHQQVVQAAQRAAFHAAQQAHVLNQAIQLRTQQQVPVKQAPFQGLRPSVPQKANLGLVSSHRIPSHDENLSSADLNPHNNASQGEIPCLSKQNAGVAPHHSGQVSNQVQDGTQEIKLWNEVDQVDQELRKWVQMCQQLIEQIPKQADESPQTMPESLKNLAATAIKTHQDLEKVYERFRKEVEIASSQVNALKQHKQQQQASEHTLSGEPISILPTKLLRIIESTLSATFSILGNITKLGVVNASNSGSPEQSSFSAATVMEKPQPQVAAVVPPSPPANIKMGHAQSIPYQYYYPCLPRSSNDSHGALNESSEIGDRGVTYRLRQLAPSYTYSPHFSSTYKYPIGELQPQMQNPVQILPQGQLQQHQNPQQNQTLSQQTQSLHQHPLQQIHLQQYQQAQFLQQALRDSSAPRQNICMDNKISSFNMDDFRKWRG